MKRWSSILLWSVIAAAFIGPGTVTTAASAGVAHGYALLWALAFSTVATLVLQEAAGRLTTASGRSLGEALRAQHPRGAGGALVLALVLGAVVLGCAAYEAGNILGGVAGATLFSGLAPRTWTVILGAAAAALLWTRPPQGVARILSVAVALMGVAFLWAAVRLAPPPGEIARGLLVPSLPSGSALLALGLVGTTVVPYNLFLGSGLARGERLLDMRIGLTVSIVLGGVISMAILVVGASMDGSFEFEALASALTARLGPAARAFTGLGLLAAGLSSAVTAPLAAAMTAQSLFGGPAAVAAWRPDGWRFRAIWGGVLGTGMIFGLSGVRPVPAIIAAQALNGVLLPFVACFVLLAVNDRALMGGATNGRWANVVLALVVAVTVLLGAAGVLRAGAAAIGAATPGPGAQLGAGALACVAAGAMVRFLGRRGRRALPRTEEEK